MKLKQKEKFSIVRQLAKKFKVIVPNTMTIAEAIKTIQKRKVN